MPLLLPPLYPIVDLTACPVSLSTLVSILAARGINIIQLREKKTPSRRFLRDAVELVKAARPFDLTVILNDRVDLAWLSEAQGVHLGQEDLPVDAARKIMGKGRIIGLSTHNLSQALEAQDSSADYVAIGPVFPTHTKENPHLVVSGKELQEIRRRVTKPLVAIGGITSENAGDLLKMGLDSVAVIRDLFASASLADKVAAFAQLQKPPRI